MPIQRISELMEKKDVIDKAVITGGEHAMSLAENGQNVVVDCADEVTIRLPEVMDGYSRISYGFHKYGVGHLKIQETKQQIMDSVNNTIQSLTDSIMNSIYLEFVPESSKWVIRTGTGYWETN